jgi:sensor c-di-GMP phosphodiesterase-like protein
LGLTIAADGIEGIEQESSLITSGCVEGQGALFSAPICGTDTLRLFASENTTSLRVLGRK